MNDTGSRNSIFAIFLGLPGVILWLGGLWICYTAALIHLLDLVDWNIYTAAQQKRLIIIYSIAPFTPIIGYAMIVLASVLCGFDHYRLPPKQAIALAALNAGQQFLVLLALCQIILTIGPPPVYDLLSPPVLIGSGLLILLFLLLRRFTRRKNQEWRKLASGPTNS